MPRSRVILQSDFPYTISARCLNRDWFTIEMPEVWNIFCQELTRTTADHNLKVHTFILMSNHFHLIASTPEKNISQCMHQFMHRSSLRLARAGNRINETFAGRHYKCILHDPCYYLNAYKYNYRNPVTAGICDNVEDYPYSTLQAELGRAQPSVPCAEDTTYRFDPDGTMKWLNTAPTKVKLEAVRVGFRRPYFRSKQDRNNRPILKINELI